MVTQHNTSAATAGSASATQGRQRGWTNVPAQRQEKITVVIADRKEKGAHNVPPAKQDS